MSYHQQSFSARSGTMGNIAEAIFEEHWPASHVRYGLNLPPISMSMLPEMIRHTPDFLTSTCLVEVAGLGRDQIAKWKTVKHQALLAWDDIFDTRVFWWDSSKKRYGDCSITALNAVLRKKAVTTHHFHDGPEYKAIPAELLPVDWTVL